MTSDRSSAVLRRQLVALLRAQGSLHHPAVARALRAVPREIFLPDVVEREGLGAVYQDRAIITKTDARGMPTSSSSQPAIMAIMLERLALEPGLRVLEVGAGTGYNAALLATLVGPGGRVVSVEIDAETAAAAGRALAQGGYPVEVVTGDGRQGWSAGAPYDRIIVTAAAGDVPRAWADQLVPCGLLELPLCLANNHQVVVTLRKEDDRLGPVHAVMGGFMRLRASADEVAWKPDSQVVLTEGSAVAGRTTGTLSGAGLAALSGAARRRLLSVTQGSTRAVRLPVRAPWPALHLFVVLAAPEDRLVQRWDGPASSTGLVSRDGRSLAVLRRGSLVTRVDSWGSPAAAEELAALVHEWLALGRPSIERLRTAAYFGHQPTAWRTSARDECVLAFDWA